MTNYNKKIKSLKIKSFKMNNWPINSATTLILNKGKRKYTAQDLFKASRSRLNKSVPSFQESFNIYLDRLALTIFSLASDLLDQ